MKTYILDTNFLHSLWSIDDSNHQKAIKLAENIDADDLIIIPVIVIAELMAGPLSDKFNVIYACKTISKKIVTSTKDDLTFIRQIPCSKRTKLKANDLLILSICQKLKGELVTFDKALKATFSKFVKLQ